jgi:WD40 repeat protein
VYKALKAHPSALYKVKPLTVNLIATGDEDGTVKLWDNRTKTSKLLSKHSVLYKRRQLAELGLILLCKKPVITAKIPTKFTAIINI